MTVSLVLIIVALVVFFGRGRLPYPLDLPINRFYISHHNVIFDSYVKIGDMRHRAPVKNPYGTSLSIDDFAGKKIFYDKKRDYYAVMAGVFFTPVIMTKLFRSHRS